MHARSFGKRHVHLGDNLGLVLAAEKGRSNAFGLLRVCRRLCALVLASDCSLSYRWIPSELNVADHASRQWEPLRLARDAQRGSRKSEVSKAEIDSRIYPNRFRAGKYRTADVVGSGSGCSARWPEQVSGSPASTTAQSQDPRREEGQENSVCQGQNFTPKVPRSVFVGAGSSFRQGGRPLPEQVHGVSEVQQNPEDVITGVSELRQGLREFSESYVSGRGKRWRSIKNHGCRSRLSPRMWPQDSPPSIETLSSGMASIRPSTDTSSTTSAPGCPDHSGDVGEEAAVRGSFSDAHVRGLSQAMGAARHWKGGSGDAKPVVQTSWHKPTSIKQRRSFKDGAARRIHPAGQQGHALSREMPSAHTRHAPTRNAPPSRSQSSSFGLGRGADESGAKQKPCRAASAQALRPQLRQAGQCQDHAGDQDARPLGSRLIGEEVRKPCMGGSGIPEPPKEDPAIGTGSRRCTSKVGPQIFQSEVEWNGYWVVEIFSGCARLSRACARVGFHVIAYDIEYGPGCDMLDPKSVAQLLRFMKSRRIALVWLGTPCTSWSRARRDDGGPKPLSWDDSEFLMGFSNVAVKDLEKIVTGNRLLDISYKIFNWCINHSISCVMENPYSSRLWLTSAVKMLQDKGALLSRADFCAYGTPWRKSTGFLHHGFPGLPSICQCCTTNRGRCCFSGRKHIVLAGKDASGLWMTRVAQPYPYKMCAVIAGLLRGQGYCGG